MISTGCTCDTVDDLDPSLGEEISLNALDHTPLVDIGVLLDIGIVRQLEVEPRARLISQATLV
jgi:hypothetical protein